MRIEETRLSGVCLLRPRRVSDIRSYLQQSWSAAALAEIGLEAGFVQETQYFLRMPGTVRGLSYQAPPHGQTVLTRVVAGEVLHVAVDVRQGSETYAQWTCAILSAANGRQMLVPEGFLRGFITLAPDTTVLNKLSAGHYREAEGCVDFADPDLAIDWGMPAHRMTPTPGESKGVPFASWSSPFVRTPVAA